jgi:hypothetical protein
LNPVPSAVAFDGRAEIGTPAPWVFAGLIVTLDPGKGRSRIEWGISPPMPPEKALSFAAQARLGWANNVLEIAYIIA